MAYAAVLSLNQNLEQISNPHLEQHKTPLQDQQIKFLQEKLSFLLDFLDDSWQRRSEELRCLEREIRDVAYKAEDMVESHISKNFGEEDFQERQMRDQTFCVNFKIVADEIDCIKTKADKLKELWGATGVHRSQRSTSLPTGQSSLLSIGKNATVGHHNDLIQIMDRLTRYPPSLEVIPVTGMGGIGKTTLARNVYDHPQIEFRFHTRAWASISQEYREREVLLSLLDSMKQFSAEKDEWNSTEKDKGNSTEVLKECVYKSLKGRRYLVVMDDVWTTEAWDSLRRIFPDDGIGSRIMLTTCQPESVVDPHYSLHRMPFLNETDSWSLLCQKVFGEDSCPIELEEAGKEIAENCKGLPLSLVVIGGHLKANRTRDHWEYVAQNVKSVVNETGANCSEILSLSYDYLPHKLKACFLYMGVFPEDHIIRVSKLIKLWVAEGFLKPVNDKTLEEVAEGYLGDLISRNLILIRNRSSRGKIKTCSIHDMLRDLCVRKAQEEKFFHVTDKDFRIFAEGIKYSRRLCINPDIFHKELSNSDNSNVKPSMGSLPPVRSILCFCLGSEIYESGDRNLFPLLRVLNLGKGYVDGFPIGETKLVHTRYLSFSFYGKIQEELKDWGNDSFQVHVLHVFQEIHPAIKEPEAEIIARLWSNDDTLQLEATTLFWNILFFDRDQIQPIKELIPRVVPRFLEFLARDDHSQLQFQAALVLSTISGFSSDNINILIDHGAVPILVSLLNSPQDVLREEALQMLGNIAGDSTKSRDLVLSYGVLMPLLEQLNDKTEPSIMRNATIALVNLCQGEPWPQFEQVKSALLHLADLIHTKDQVVLSFACEALVHVTAWKKDIIQAVIDAGVFPRLVEILLYPSEYVFLPALQIVHNIIKTGDAIRIQVLIDNGTLPCLPNLLTQNDLDETRIACLKVTCQIISGIIERTKDHVQAVIEAGIIAPLVQLLPNADFELQDAAARAILVATMEGTNEQIKFLVDEGCIKPLCDLLVSPNGADIIKYCLGGLENILKVGEDEKNQGNTKDVNVFAQMIDDAGGLQKIKNLQTHDNSEICEEAVKILETYWKEVDDEQLRSGAAPQSGCFCCTFIDRFLCFLP